jgi:hypothetical protein
MGGTAAAPPAPPITVGRPGMAVAAARPVPAARVRVAQVARRAAGLAGQQRALHDHGQEVRLVGSSEPDEDDRTLGVRHFDTTASRRRRLKVSEVLLLLSPEPPVHHGYRYRPAAAILERRGSRDRCSRSMPLRLDRTVARSASVRLLGSGLRGSATMGRGGTAGIGASATWGLGHGRRHRRHGWKRRRAPAARWPLPFVAPLARSPHGRGDKDPVGATAAAVVSAVGQAMRRGGVAGVAGLERACHDQLTMAKKLAAEAMTPTASN